MVADIVEVLEEEGEEARRMVVAGGQRQPAAHNVPATAMKLILPAVQKKEEGKGRRGRTGVGEAGGGDSGVHTGGHARPGKGGKGQVSAPGAKKTAGHQEAMAGKGGGQGHQWL